MIYVHQEVGPHSYEVTSPDGIYHRNRRHLNPLPGPPPADTQDNTKDAIDMTGESTEQPLPTEST